MTGTGITLEDIHLYYASVAFKERSVKSLLGSFVTLGKKREKIEDIHALKGITLSIEPGERVGLIGHNGAGKSTLLKLIAGLYPISSGRREVAGTVRSLLDISLGFEPDATGRENILYRGLLLGLAPKFMHSIEDKIVEFADIGKFIDYPIKTYSAGMLIRLAFAISTNVGGNILLLDEIIGAGDAVFMAKAKQRIADLVDEAEIVLLASHDVGTLKAICKRGLVLEKGELLYDGPLHEALAFYHNLHAGVAPGL